ncbi:CopC domain-containing protein YobA [Kluyvera sp. STS39-E]|uniref:CopC domain-containing protein YobA n=1 Tax=Kluyvera sp. STS39-E TaxID=3234748 RepID=UPI0034C6CF56
MKFTTPRAFCTTLFALTVLSSSPVWAHAHLEKQSPPENSQTSPSPQALTLNFSEGIEANFSGVTVKDADGKTIPIGKAARSESDKTQLVVPLPEALASGLYTVEWHVVSVDGHKTKGQYQFSVK